MYKVIASCRINALPETLPGVLPWTVVDDSQPIVRIVASFAEKITAQAYCGLANNGSV